MYANSRNGTSMVGDAHGVLCEFSYEVVGLPLARILPVADAPQLSRRAAVVGRDGVRVRTLNGHSVTGRVWLQNP